MSTTPYNSAATDNATERLIEVPIPDEFIELCSGWAGDTDCMLRAIDSTGGLTLGSHRPWSLDAHRHKTDREWQVSLFQSLSSDASYLARMAEKSGHEDAPALRRLEAFADSTVDRLKIAYELTDSEVV